MVPHRRQRVQERSDGEQQDQGNDQAGKDNDEKDGPCQIEAFLGESIALGFPARGLLHVVELIVARGTCVLTVSEIF